MNGEERICVNISQEKSSKNASKRIYSDELSTPTRRSTRIQKLKTSTESCNKEENDHSNASPCASPTKKLTNKKSTKAVSSSFDKDTETSKTFFQVDNEGECFESIFDDIFEQNYSKTLQSLLPKNLNTDPVKERKFFKTNSLDCSKLKFSTYVCNKSTLPTEDVSKVFKIISKPNVLSDATTESKASSKPVLKTYSNKRRNFQKNDVIETFGLPDRPIAPENMQPMVNNELDVEIQDVNEITILDVDCINDPWIITADGEDLLPIFEEVRKKSEPIQECFAKNGSFLDFNDFENFMEPTIFASTPVKNESDKALCTLNSTSVSTKLVNKNKEIDIEAIKKNFKKMLSRTGASEPLQQSNVKTNNSVSSQKKNSLVSTNNSSVDSDMLFRENENLTIDNKELSNDLPVSTSNNTEFPENSKNKKHNSTCARKDLKTVQKKLQISVNNEEEMVKNFEKNKNILRISTRKQKMPVNKEKVSIDDIEPKKNSETDTLTSNTKCNSQKGILEDENNSKSMEEHGEVSCESGNSINNKRVLRSSLHNNSKNPKLTEVQHDGHQDSANEVNDKINKQFRVEEQISLCRTFEMEREKSNCKSSSQTELEEKKVGKLNATKGRNIRSTYDSLEHHEKPPKSTPKLCISITETFNQQINKVSDVKITLEKCHYEGKPISSIEDNPRDILQENDNIEKLLLPLKNGKKSIPQITVVLNQLDIAKLNKKPENVKFGYVDTLSATKRKLRSTKAVPNLLKSNENQETKCNEFNLDIKSTVNREVKDKLNETEIDKNSAIDTVEIACENEENVITGSDKTDSQKTVDDKIRRKDVKAKVCKSDEVNDILNKPINASETHSTNNENLEIEIPYLNHSELRTEEKIDDCIKVSHKESELHKSSLLVSNEQKRDGVDSVKHKKNVRDSSLELKPCNVNLINVDSVVNCGLTNTCTNSEANPVVEAKMKSSMKNEQDCEGICLKSNAKPQNNTKISTNYIDCDQLKLRENLNSSDTSGNSQRSLFIKGGIESANAREEENLELQEILFKKEGQEIIVTTSVTDKMKTVKYFNDDQVRALEADTSEKIEDCKGTDLSVDTKKLLCETPVKTITYSVEEKSKPVEIAFQSKLDREENCNYGEIEAIRDAKPQQNLENLMKSDSGNDKKTKAFEDSLEKHGHDEVKDAEKNLETNNSISFNKGVSIEIISKENLESLTNESDRISLTTNTKSNINSKSAKAVEKNSGFRARLKEKRQKLLGLKAVSAEESLRRNERQPINKSTLLSETNKVLSIEDAVNATVSNPETTKKKRGRPRRSDVGEKCNNQSPQKRNGNRQRGRSPIRKSLDDMDLLNSYKVYHKDRLKRSKSVARSVLETKLNDWNDSGCDVKWIGSHIGRKASRDDGDLPHQSKEVYTVKMKQNRITPRNDDLLISCGKYYKGKKESVTDCTAEIKRDSKEGDQSTYTKNMRKESGDKDEFKDVKNSKSISPRTDENLKTGNTKNKFDACQGVNVRENLEDGENVQVDVSPTSSEKKITTGSDFKIGDLTWAQIGYYPFWPCMITNEPGTKFFKKTIQAKRFTRELYHVRFFGDNGKRAWISKQQIMDYYNSDDLQILQEKMKAENKIIPSTYIVKVKQLQRWKGAVEEAELLKLKSVKQRLQFFMNVLSKGNSPKQKGPSNSDTVSKDTDLIAKRRSNENKAKFSEDDGTKQRELSNTDVVLKDATLATDRKSNENKNIGSGDKVTKEKEPLNDIVTGDATLSTNRKSIENKDVCTGIDSETKKDLVNANAVPKEIPLTAKRKSNDNKYSEVDTETTKESVNADILPKEIPSTAKRKSNEQENICSEGGLMTQKACATAQGNIASTDTPLVTKRRSNELKNICSEDNAAKEPENDSILSDDIPVSTRIRCSKHKHMNEKEITDIGSSDAPLSGKRKSNENKNTCSDCNTTKEKVKIVSRDSTSPTKRKSARNTNIFSNDDLTKQKEPATVDSVPNKRKSNVRKNVFPEVNSPKLKVHLGTEIVVNNAEDNTLTLKPAKSSNATSAAAKRKSNDQKNVFPDIISPKLASADNTSVSIKRKSNEHKNEAKHDVLPNKTDDEKTPVQRRQKKKVSTEIKANNENISDNANLEGGQTESGQIQEENIQLNENFLSRIRLRRQVDEVSEVASKSSSDNVVDSDISLNSMDVQKALYKRNNLFRGISREKVCQYCYKPTEVLKCKGRCNGSYHISCSLKILKEVVPRGRKRATMNDSNIVHANGESTINNDNILHTNEDNNKPYMDQKPESSDVSVAPSEVDESCSRKESYISSLKEEEQVQIITVPSSVYNTPPRKTFPPNFKNMTLAEQIDYKMKEIMRKFETDTFYSETSSESSSEDISRAQSLPQVTSIGPASTSEVTDEKDQERNGHEPEPSESNDRNINTVSEGITKLGEATKIDKQTVTKVTPIIKKKLFIKHITADSERETVQEETLDVVKKSFKCGFCASDLYPYCFVCHRAVSKKGSNIRQKCSVYPCGRFYHPECLKMWPQTQWSLIQTTRHKDSDKDMDSFVCPLHVCHTCVSDDPRAATSRCSGDKTVKCLRCPSTYHSSNLCVPAGTTVLSSSQIICPRHRETSKLFTINTTWCFLCSNGGNLICCETCPTSVHPECLPVNLTDDDKFICEDCESGRLPLYDEIVWVKLGKFRWWPAVILFPNEVPDNIKNMKHGTGEFVVKFFGTYDYYWVNRGRSFLFQEGDTGQCNSVKKKVDLAFNRAVDEAVVAHKLKKEFKLSQEVESISSLKPPPYIRIKVNKPVGNVRHLDLDLSSTNACECDPNKPHPCGPESDCLNRLLMTECNPDVCPAGSRCKNQSFEKREYPPLVPYKTQGRGWGLKTLAPIKKGQFVIEYVGELIDSEEYQRRIQKMHAQKEENYYFLTIDKDRMIDAGPKGNAARFMNHCCQPNCETQKWTVNGDTRVGLFANVDIPADTELTFNYNLECVGKEKKVCRCGAPNCSGFIGVKAKQDTDNIIKKPKRPTKKKEPVKPVVLPPCFICRKKKGLVICCNNKVCNKAYHRECLNTTDQLESSKFICPWHNCNVCSKRTIRCCVKCINSYCPSHADGNIRYDNLLGFVCTTHDRATPLRDVHRVRLKKKRTDVITEETAVTSTTSDLDENDDWIPKLARRRVNSKQAASSNDIESDNDSSVGRSLKGQPLASDYESQDEGTVSSATLTDVDERIVVKRKRGQPKSRGRPRKRIKLSNEQSIGITASSSVVDDKLRNHSNPELTSSHRDLEN